MAKRENLKLERATKYFIFQEDISVLTLFLHRSWSKLSVPEHVQVPGVILGSSLEWKRHFSDPQHISRGFRNHSSTWRAGGTCSVSWSCLGKPLTWIRLRCFLQRILQVGIVWDTGLDPSCRSFGSGLSLELQGLSSNTSAGPKTAGKLAWNYAEEFKCLESQDFRRSLSEITGF